MTHNQIEYWKLQEQKRANLANERETNRSNVARESENYRHNTVTERETNRHNTVGEAQVWSSQAETQRHNLASEGLTAESLNVQRQRNADLAWKESMDVLLHNQSNRETQRHNQSLESVEQYRASEIERHNRQNEKLDKGKFLVDSANKLVETPAEAWKDYQIAGNQMSGALKNYAQGITSVFKLFS